VQIDPTSMTSRRGRCSPWVQPRAARVPPQRALTKTSWASFVSKAANRRRPMARAGLAPRIRPELASTDEGRRVVLEVLDWVAALLAAPSQLRDRP
jgi:hypothetical protein